MGFSSYYLNLRVLVTGHTGFKGSWLTEWLLLMGANVTGFSLPPPTSPSLFGSLEQETRIRHVLGDINDADLVASVVQETQPDIIFHLAAQPLVRLSYAEPVKTYQTNVMGTINVLEAARKLKGPCAVVCITTDKCYENREWLYGYREEDALGGYDPYSSSKAAAEIAISSWRRSFYSPAKIASGQLPPVGIASARAGNVIGGGDWALDRIIPDCMRALAAGHAIGMRNPKATRPWQHVLEPLSGYLQIASELHRALSAPEKAGAARIAQLCSPFNFGPPLDSNRSVATVVSEVLKHWPGRAEDLSDSNAVHEASLLNLVADKAYHLLGWQSRWSFSETIERTVAWYRVAATHPTSDVLGSLTRKQIADYAALI